MPDNIGRLLSEVRKFLIERQNKLGTKNRPFRYFFSGKLLNDVSDVFETSESHFGAARLFLIDKLEKERNKREIEAILEVLQRLETCKEVRDRPSIGRAILKNMNTLLSTEVLLNDY